MILQHWLGASWKTSCIGLGQFLVVAGNSLTAFTDGNAATQPDLTMLLTSALVAVGFLKTRDKSVSSEQEGIKP